MAYLVAKDILPPWQPEKHAITQPYQDISSSNLAHMFFVTILLVQLIIMETLLPSQQENCMITLRCLKIVHSAIIQTYESILISDLVDMLLAAIAIDSPTGLQWEQENSAITYVCNKVHLSGCEQVNAFK